MSRDARNLTTMPNDGDLEKSPASQPMTPAISQAPSHTSTLIGTNAGALVGDEKGKDKEVFLDQSEDPKRLPKARKWLSLFIICTAAICVTCDSSAAGFTEKGLQESFGISHEVAILSISLFIAGLGIGPLLLGPMSEYFGRSRVYIASYFFLFVLTFGVAFAPNAPVHFVFRFISGFSGSAFLSVAGGSVTDLFADHEVAIPMAMYSLSPFLGPIIGPLFSGFINQNTTWRWTYYALLIWQAVEFICLATMVPETYEPVLRQRKAAKIRKETGDQGYYAPLDNRGRSVLQAVIISCYKPFEILAFEPMALLLDIWSALLLGILYLTFQAFPIIFEQVHGFNEQSTGLTFLGMGIGMVGTIATQPFFRKIQRKRAEKYDGKPPPETRLIVGFVGAILVPISLFWLAFTTYKKVHWIVPIIASIPFGSGIVFVYTAVFTYLVVAYRMYAASAMAGNSFLRSSFAAVFPLFATPMFDRLGTVGAVALLAGLSTIMAPLPFLFFKYGARLRQHSRFASS
ncbi:MFS general substrate transporter [Sistotremastrum niveocremeum HHB9708]|uniref:MFS general substrate transporter n=1 Tax=Sistotremastrum niveocremeum HHB9708 TaxID=1314777 RepID=A0A164X1E9_9AGAM|nr:MFS general substrate transporter [Sistotremastrum niveocremeum HHB9708]